MRDEREYASWLRLAVEWSGQLRVRPDRLELIIFSDALNEDSSWKLECPGRTTSTPTVPRGRLTCSEAIAVVLADSTRPLQASQIAQEINRRGLYQRGDGRPLPAYQVSSVAHASTRRFSIQHTAS
jgi:hypothetical protein